MKEAYFKEGKESIYPKKWLIQTGIKIIISCALIIWIFRKASLNEVFIAVQSADVPLLLAAFFLAPLGYYVCANRWRVLLDVQGAKGSISHLIKSNMAALFFNNFLPSTIGGDALRVYDSYRLTCSKSKAVVVIFMDRFLGLMALLLLALGALIVSEDLTQKFPLLKLGIALGAIGGILGVWMVFMLPSRFSEYIPKLRFLFLPGLQGILQNIINACLSFQGKHHALAQGLILSFALQINVVLHYYLVAQALAFNVSLYNFFLIIPIALFLMMIPLSINGIGIRENAFLFLFSTFGVSQPQVIALAWITYGFVILQGIIGGIVYMLRR